MHKSLVLEQVYFIPLHVSSTCAHHQEVKIALHSLWTVAWITVACKWLLALFVRLFVYPTENALLKVYEDKKIYKNLIIRFK
jgi:hypothetical protein